MTTRGERSNWQDGAIYAPTLRAAEAAGCAFACVGILMLCVYMCGCGTGLCVREMTGAPECVATRTGVSRVDGAQLWRECTDWPPF